MSKSYFVSFEFAELYELKGDMQMLLNGWKISLDNNSIRNFVDFVTSEYSDLANHRGKLHKQIGEQNVRKLLIWVGENKPLIQEAFFKYSDSDKEFAEEASNALYILENS